MRGDFRRGEIMKRIGHVAHLLVIVVAMLRPVPAVGQPDTDALRGMTIDELKRIYLRCDRAATRHRLSAGAIAACSVVYEELKWRAFDGDFEKLLAWSRLQPG
jgi:hypothetical protein